MLLHQDDGRQISLINVLLFLVLACHFTPAINESLRRRRPQLGDSVAFNMLIVAPKLTADEGGGEVLAAPAWL